MKLISDVDFQSFLTVVRKYLEEDLKNWRSKSKLLDKKGKLKNEAFNDLVNELYKRLPKYFDSCYKAVEKIKLSVSKNKYE
jgi:hypothetical protein